VNAELESPAAAGSKPKRRRGRVLTRVTVCDRWTLLRDGQTYGPGAEVRLAPEDAEALRVEGAVRDPDDVDDP
jgi:hypothetical protein